MKTTRRSFALLILLAASATAASAANQRRQSPAPGKAGFETLYHHLEVTLNPSAGTLEATDTLTFPPGPAHQRISFLLHDGLTLRCQTPGATVKREDRAPTPGDFPAPVAPGSRPNAGRSGSATPPTKLPDAVPAALYTLTLPGATAGPRQVTLSYSGSLCHPIAATGPEYARAFSETPGLISAQGVFLCGQSLWAPWFGDGLVRFDLAVRLPKAWDAVSQGERILHETGDDFRRTAWRCADPAEEIYLVAGPFTEYAAKAGDLAVFAFLRTPDANLARRYLEATGRYADLYKELIGSFPYQKFALVENFWETGYGMPSFTLLGEKVIRLPFILHSSYPHELLHNYWGNSVFVDASGGNWCEGLATYLADHLIAQQKGQDVDYRRSTLQKYVDYVKPENDAPLAAFRERRDAVTEALGYGKAMMVFHMLRQMVGDEAFRRGLAAFYRQNRFRRATWTDLQSAFAAVAGRDLAPFFRRWVEEPGAPRLKVEAVQAQPKGSGWEVAFRLAQEQPGAPFHLEVPVAVTLAGKPEALVFRCPLATRTGDFRFSVPQQPVRLDVDPAFDLFRTLDPRESPPTFSRLLGAQKLLLVLPGDADGDTVRAYRELADAWAKDRLDKVQIIPDSEFTTFPPDAFVWVFGWENRLLARLDEMANPMGAGFSPRLARIEGRETPRAGRCVAAALPHPASPSLAVGWLAADAPTVVAGLSRKLPHYGKYGWLTFEGSEPVNTGKGGWPATRSPLTVALQARDNAAPFPNLGRLPPVAPLASLPPSYSVEALRRQVETLAAPAMEGRGFDSPGLDAAAEHLAAAFRAAGLRPGGNKEFFQEFEAPCQPGGKPARLRNVVGILPGKDPSLAGQSVVIGAHYDHLGKGYPVARAGNAGQIHPGADDNASGVAVLLELAKSLAQGEAPDRTLVFVAFTAEECGMVGARQYLQAAGAFPPDQIQAMVNLDTLGRLGSGKLLVIGVPTAREWAFILAGAGYVTGLQHEVAQEGLDSGDQVPFAAKGIPAIHLFTPPHADYHTPGDTADKIDYAGLLRITEYTREIIDYLGGRKEPLTSPRTANAPSRSDGTASGPAQTAPGGPGGRRVGIGIMPDFAFQGSGVRVSSVTEGGPAAAAGVKVGDVIVRVEDQPVATLKAYSEVTKALAPGRGVTLTLDRDGREVRLMVVPVVR